MVIYIYDITELYDSVFFKRGMDLLPWPERRQKLRRYRFEKDRCLSLGAGLALAYALVWRIAHGSDADESSGISCRSVDLAACEDLCGDPDAEMKRELELALTERGKPYLLHHPEIYFSISHSGRLAVCAASDKPVGIDAQEIRSYDAGIATLAFSAKERAWLAGQSDGDRAFTRLWTRKESYLKMTGEGITVDLQDISLEPYEYTDGRAKPFLFDETEISGHMICACSSCQP